MTTTRRALLPAVSLFVLLGAPVARAADEAAYRIERYDLRIEPDFAAGRISLTATIRIANPGLSDEFSYGLSDRYETVEAKCAETPVAVTRDKGRIAVKLAKRVAALTLVFELRGAPGASDSSGRPVIDATSLYLLWSDRFYPVDFDHWAPVRTEILLPPGFKAIAPGRRRPPEPDGARTRHVFETSKPAVCYSVFADSEWIESERTPAGIPLRALLHPESRAHAEAIFRTSAEILGFYAELLGPYPFDEFGFVTMRGLDARRAMSGFVGYDPAYLDKEMASTGYDAHETSLLWWGYGLRGAGPGAFQWTEGFGDYAEILYGERYGKPLPRIFRFFRDQYLAVPADQDLLYSDLRGNTPQKLIHGKYPWLMHVLRYVAGDAPFRRALRLLFDRYRFRTFSMDELIAVLEEGCGRSLKGWREEWLERKGVPELAWRTEIRPADGRFEIACAVEQKGALFHLPLEVGIRTASGTRIERIEVSGPLTTATFFSAEKPEEIRLDPNGWILMKVAAAAAAK